MTVNVIDYIHKVNYLYVEIDNLYHRAAFKIGCSDSVMHILYKLYDNSGCCMLNDIYKQQGISKQTINSALRKLEKEEIIYSEQCTGKRKKVCLTQKGKDYAEKTAGLLSKLETDIFSSWTEDEIDMYIHFIEKYIDLLRQKVDEL